jgi:fatty-acyl-CoA synthase
MIVSGGENIYPKEVEDTLHEHPSVTSAAVVGASDSRWGAVVTAFVVADGDLSADDLGEFCLESDSLEDFKRPRRYHFRETLPRTQSGKIAREPLRETLDED